MEVEIRDDVQPICPHCERELERVLVNTKLRVPTFFGGDYGQVYICPHCHKVLGFADYK